MGSVTLLFLWTLAALLGFLFASGPQPPPDEGVGATPAPLVTVVPTPVPPALAAAIQGRPGSHAPVSTPTPTPMPRVRTIYAVPSDRTKDPHYANAVRDAIVHVQDWYAGQLEGATFEAEEPIPLTCAVEHPAEYYESEHGWRRVIETIQHCAPVRHLSDEYVWVIYIDVGWHCDGKGELGRGGEGITILTGGDLEGLVSPDEFLPCPDSLPRSAYGWIGGLAHEIGHAFGLPHPPGCEESLNTCDQGALMWWGYYWDYPETYLTKDDQAALQSSMHFHHRLERGE